MTIKFSPSTRGFYDTSFHASIPLDAVEISPARYRELLDGQAQGKQITLVEGQPMLQDPPAAPREVLVAQSWAAIQAERDRRMQSGGFMVRGKWFHSDIFSRTQYLGMMQAGQAIADAGIQWKTMDHSFVPITPELAQEVFAAGCASDPSIFAVAEKHKAAMLESPNPLAYDFSGGWPVCFTDLNPSAA